MKIKPEFYKTHTKRMEDGVEGWSYIALIDMDKKEELLSGFIFEIDTSGNLVYFNDSYNYHRELDDFYTKVSKEEITEAIDSVVKTLTTIKLVYL